MSSERRNFDDSKPPTNKQIVCLFCFFFVNRKQQTLFDVHQWALVACFICFFYLTKIEFVKISLNFL